VQCITWTKTFHLHNILLEKSLFLCMSYEIKKFSLMVYLIKIFLVLYVALHQILYLHDMSHCTNVSIFMVNFLYLWCMNLLSFMVYHTEIFLLWYAILHQSLYLHSMSKNTKVSFSMICHTAPKFLSSKSVSHDNKVSFYVIHLKPNIFMKCT
jgi:hypothetical protein